MWRVVGASKSGTSHLRQGLPCQDAHYWVQSGDLLIAAVADGAGSASLAEVGSQLAVKTAVDFLAAQSQGNAKAENPWKDWLLSAFETARTALKEEAEKRSVNLSDLATTLIIAVASPEFVAMAQIGDGAIVVGDHSGQITSLSAPSQVEYLNETTFLTALDALVQIQFQVWNHPPRHLALLTDGLQMLALKMPTGKAHPPFFAPLFRFVETVEEKDAAQTQLLAFLGGERVTQRTDDDLSLLLAVFTE
jgi:Protein phosphatase 2C